MKSEDFEKVKIIGRGAFGEVQLVRASCHFSFPVSVDAVLRHTKTDGVLSIRSVTKRLRRSTP